MKKTKTQKGITLIALIITIIVLLILAVVAINAIQNDGIIEHAKNARESYQTAQTNEQAILDGYLSKLNGDNSGGTSSGGTDNNNSGGTPSGGGSSESEEDTGSQVREIIPEGGTYIVGSGPYYDEENGSLMTWAYGTTVYSAGDPFPEEINTFDIYRYGNYEYCYKAEYGYSTDGIEMWVDYDYQNQTNINLNGWGVKCIKNVANPGPCLEEIRGKVIESMAYTYMNISSLNNLSNILIPDSVTSLDNTFSRM